jgi:hypothetical protein
MEAMVSTLWVMSSPVTPSPRVAARTSFPVAVEQVDGQAVDLQLGEPADAAAGLRCSMPAEARRSQHGELLEREDVLDAVHALEMLDRREGRGDVPADLLRRGVVGAPARGAAPRSVSSRRNSSIELASETVGAFSW